MVRHADSKSPALARVIERQMRNWELTHEQQPGRKEQAAPREVADFICISREVGAGGQEIATAVGERLGWPVFGKELLHLMAGDDAYREPIYAALDEHDTGWLESMVRTLMDNRFIRDDYFRKLGETVLALARKGSAVFIGRGVELILPKGVGLRVRIVAPRSMRVACIAEREGVSLERAQKRIKTLEEERAAFVRGHFGVEVGDPSRYDLVINLERLTRADAVDLIVRAHESTQQRP